MFSKRAQYGGIGARLHLGCSRVNLRRNFFYFISSISYSIAVIFWGKDGFVEWCTTCQYKKRYQINLQFASRITLSSIRANVNEQYCYRTIDYWTLVNRSNHQTRRSKIEYHAVLEMQRSIDYFLYRLDGMPCIV